MKGRFWIMGAVLLVLSAVNGPMVCGEAGAYRLALVDGMIGADAAREGGDNQRDDMSSAAVKLQEQLEARGIACEVLRGEALADGQVFNRERFDGVCLVDARRYPAEAKDELKAFFHAGGDALLLGGYAFEEPRWYYRDQWLNREGMAETIPNYLTDERFVLDLETFDAAQWEHGKRQEDCASEIRVIEEQGLGRVLMLDIQGISTGDWDTFSCEIDRADDEHNAVAFYAKAGRAGRDLVIEVNEEDHSRWVYVQRLTQQWRRYVVLDRQFRFFADGSPSERGYEGDRLRLTNAGALSLGMAYGFAPFAQGDHTFYVREAATGRVDVPMSYGQSQDGMGLPIYDDTDYYVIRGAERWASYSSDYFTQEYQRDGALGGVSAVGFTYPNESAYLPLLAGYDEHGRCVGFAAGALVHYAGPYRGGRWLMAGVEDAGFYREQGVVNYLAGAFAEMVSGGLTDRLAQENERSRAKRLTLTTQRADGRIRISEDGRHFVREDGKRFFILGSNYLGSFDRKCYHGTSCFDPAYLERDFRKAHEAGINCLRFWNCGIEYDRAKMETVLELARRYGIYLLIHPTAHPKPTDEELIRQFERNAAMLRDEPMVLGYDLMNEPLITTVGSISYGGGASAILAYGAYDRYGQGYYNREWVERLAVMRGGWPELGDWVSVADAKQLYAAHFMAYGYMERAVASADASSLVGVETLRPYPTDYVSLFDAVEDTFAAWIAFHRRAIEHYDDNPLLTVGYHTPLTALEANNQLDFVSHHLYQMPRSFADMEKAVTTFDRLTALYPDKPISLGEFGYSRAYRTDNGEPLGAHSAAVAEMLVYLYAFTHDYAGAMNWMVSEWPEAVMAYNGKWIEPMNREVQSGYGLYYYDGTLTGKAKPIVCATRFLSQYMAGHEPGQGHLRLWPEDSAIHGRYVYENDDALFVGGVQFDNERLRYRHHCPVNVMLMWDQGGIRMAAGDDVTVTLKPTGWGREMEQFGDELLEGRGRYVKGNEAIELDLLAGETVRISFIPNEYDKSWQSPY